MREASPTRAGADVLGVTSQSVDADGLDRHLQRDVSMDVTPSPDGLVVSKVVVTLHNKAPKGTARQWVTLYTPGDLVGVTSDEKFLPVRAEQEAGVMAFSVFVDVPAGASRSMTFGTRAMLDRLGRYDLRVFDQPGLAQSTTKVSIGVPRGFRAIDPQGAETRGDDVVATLDDGAQADISVHFRPQASGR
jgi:hypothetical protein